MKWMIYGANGYTGELTARLAKSRGMAPILAGRNGNAVSALASELQLESRVFSLEEQDEAVTCLQDVDAVIHCAGPFSHTSAPMVNACLEARTHYLDITGEIAVFRGVFARHMEAVQAGIVLMPGVGFDVVPTDCMAARLKKELPDASRLELAFAGLGSISRGTLKTSIEGISFGGWVRRGGKLVPAPSGSIARTIPFSRKPLFGMAIPWGDVETGYRTTAIPDITVYTAVPESTVKWVRRTARFQKVAGLKGIQWALKKWVDSRPPGPDEKLRNEGYSDIWGRVENDRGEWVEGHLTTPEGYTLTAHSSLQVLTELGKIGPGAWTPAGALGEELVTRLDGVTPWDIRRGVS